MAKSKKAEINYNKKHDKKQVMDFLLERIPETSLGMGRILESAPFDPPSVSTVSRWISADVEIAERFREAKRRQMDYLAEELLEIADDSRNDFMEKELKSGESIIVANNENIQRSNLRVNTRKWIMSKLNHKQYGDRIQSDVDVKGNLTISIAADESDL